MVEGNSFEPATSAAAQKQIGLAGILAPVSGTVGLTCSPISALALEGTSWYVHSAHCNITSNIFHIAAPLNRLAAPATTSVSNL